MAVICLCCGKPVEKRNTSPVTEEQAIRATLLLTSQGHTIRALRTEHRDNLDYVWPGYADWLDRNFTADPPPLVEGPNDDQNS